MAKKQKENKVLFGNVEDFPEKEWKEKVQPDAAQKRGVFSFFRDERFLKSLGVFLLFFSVFLLLAGTSFFFNWQADQSLIRGESFGLFQLEHPEMAQNLLGIIGAWTGYIFFYKSFGLGSYAFCIIFFSIGMYLLTRLQPVPVFKTLRYSFFSVIWLSILLGMIFSDRYQVLSGVFGHFGYLYLKTLLGSIGVGLLLLLYLLVCSIAVFNIEFYKPGLRLQPERITENESTADETAADENKMLAETQDSETELPLPAEALEMELKTIEEEPGEEEPEAEIAEEPETEEEIAEDEPEEHEEEIPATVTTDDGLVLEVNETPEEPEEPIARKDHYGLDEPFDPTLEFSNYQYPNLDLLNDYGDSKGKVDNNELSEKTKMIQDTLKNYNIGIKKISATVGPTVTLYEIIPQEGVRIAKIKNLEDDIALSLAALGIRIIAPIPGRGTIGIEVPNSVPAMVPMRAVLSSSKFTNADMDLPIGFGKTISNEVFVADLAKMPHLLMAGATGQGKSVGLNTILISLLYKKHPSQIKFVLVDPKKVELSIYKTIERHFLAKIPGDADAIITDTKLVVNTLNSLCVEMDTRYDLLKDAQVRNLKEYNQKFIARKLPPNDKYAHHFLPYIVVVIDELADLMMTAGKEVEHPIARIAQLARAVGIHLILATQRPSVNIITGTIKANFPARIAFRVSQKIDSRTILDANGADQLIGKGDMLYSNGNDLVRLQCAFVDTPEVEKIANFIGSQNGNEPFLLPLAPSEGDEGGGGEFDSRDKDELFEEAARLIVTHQQGSTSLIQRKLNLGYNRAGRLIDQLEKAGIVGPFKGSKAREVLVHDILELEDRLKNL